MELIRRDKLIQSIKSEDSNTLFFDPLLDDNQVGEVTVDLRLGYDFLVSIYTRKPVIELEGNYVDSFRGIETFFQTTRRDLGDTFILYPNQCVLTTTLEYVSLPDNNYLDLLSRSSYNRLGIQINTMVQPGFRGCIPVELFNHNNNAVELVVGSRVFQTRIYELADSRDYLAERIHRKYYGEIRPSSSKADRDKDIKFLRKIASP
jgi:dCTP deaminase